MLRGMMISARKSGSAHRQNRGYRLQTPIYFMSRPKNTLCACGCGELVEKKWKRGHCGKNWEMKRKISPVKYSDEEIFVLRPDKTKSGRATHRLHRRRIETGTLRCDICGITEWRGKPVPLVVDHINGVNYDDRLENLRIVCRNCDGQLDTFAGRNKKRMKGAGVTGLHPVTASNSLL